MTILHIGLCTYLNSGRNDPSGTIAGENLLSYERIHDVLGTWPRSVFSVAEDADRYGAHRYEPLVYVPK